MMMGNKLAEALTEHRKQWFLAGIVFYLFFAAWLLYTYIPDEMIVSGNGSIQLDAPVTLQPVSGAAAKTDVEASSLVSAGSTRQTYQCRLFGILPLKKVNVIQTQEQTLYAVGKPVGIYMKMKHILVVGTKELTNAEGMKEEPGKNIVKPGDYILAINGVEVTDKEQISETVQMSGGEKITLLLERDGEEI